MKYRTLHHWRVRPKEAVAIQNKLRKLLILKRFYGNVKTIAGVDVSFRGDGKARCAVIILNYPELKPLEIAKAATKISFPYIPTLLTFREGPAILSAFKKLKTRPDVVLFDGQGIAHPRCMGEASHIGVILDVPAIGCAKSHLYGSYSMPEKHRGSVTYLKDNKKKTIGAVLRTKTAVKPIFVSCGHRMDLKNACKIVLSVSPKFRIPEPLRMAHQLAKF